MIPKFARHVKRGSLYEVIGVAEAQISTKGAGIPFQLGEWRTREIHDGVGLVIYRGEDGKYWCRPVDEFLDGRFEPIDRPKQWEHDTHAEILRARKAEGRMQSLRVKATQTAAQAQSKMERAVSYAMIAKRRRVQAEKNLKEAMKIIGHLLDQQAMPDKGLDEQIEELRKNIDAN